jgi:hypothetical protein
VDGEKKTRRLSNDCNDSRLRQTWQNWWFVADEQGRTEAATKKRVLRLGLSLGTKRGAPPFTDREITMLHLHYPTQGAAWCAHHMGRSISGVSHLAAKLGIRSASARRSQGVVEVEQDGAP